MYLINSLPVGTYKSGYDELFLKEKEFIYNDKVLGKTIPCINVHILKQYTRYRNTYKSLIDYIKKHKDEDIKLITYNVYYPYLKACVKILKKYKNVELCPIITDMPGDFGILPKSWWRKKYVMYQSKKILQALKKAKKYVFLTELMKNPLGVKDNYIVVEGIYSNLDTSNNQIVDDKKHDKKIILYTGVLNREYGILTLLDAFEKIKHNDVELWICGGIGEVDEVNRRSELDSRIKFFGNVPRAKAIEYQKTADLLVNPRPNEGEFVKYSFPSKTMEYMASGKPVIMHKLAGIPNEYDEYLNYFEDNTPDAVQKGIEKILYQEYESSVAKAKAGRQFILNEKDSKSQTKRIIDFLR